MMTLHSGFGGLAAIAGAMLLGALIVAVSCALLRGAAASPEGERPSKKEPPRPS